jgi:hypothetical protein
MTEQLQRLALAGGAALIVALALGQTSPFATASVLAASLLLASSLVLIARAATRPIARVELAVGSRARAHRESLGEQAEPAHPLTAGRPLARAPGSAFSAA